MSFITVESPAEANGRDGVQLTDDQFARVPSYGAVGWKPRDGGVRDGEFGLGGEGVA